MILLTTYRLARDLRNTRRELADKDAAYKRMATRLQQALTQLAGHDGCAEREAALFAKVAQVEEYASQMEAERDDARREVDDVRAALCWLEGNFFKEVR